MPCRLPTRDAVARLARPVRRVAIVTTAHSIFRAFMVPAAVALTSRVAPAQGGPFVRAPIVADVGNMEATYTPYVYPGRSDSTVMTVVAPVARYQLFWFGNRGNTTGSFTVTPLCSGIVTNCVLEGMPATQVVESMTGLGHIWVTFTVTGPGTGKVQLISTAPARPSGLVEADTGLLTVIADQPAPVVTAPPAPNPRHLVRDTWNTDTFTVRNAGAVTRTYQLTPQVSPTEILTAAEVAPASLTLDPGASAPVRIIYYTHAVAGPGTVKLIARYTGVGSDTASGSATYNVLLDSTYTPYVSPRRVDSTKVNVAPPVTQSQRFTFGNSGTATGTFTVAPLCTGVVTNCVLAGGAAAQSVASMTGLGQIWVTYTVSTGGSGTVRLISTAPPRASGLVEVDTGLVTVIADQLAPVVTAPPAPNPRHLVRDMWNTDTFTVRNVGAVARTYQLTSQVSPTQILTAAEVAPVSLTLAPGASAPARITYYTQAVAGPGAVKLIAKYTGVGSDTASGSATYNVLLDSTYRPYMEPGKGEHPTVSVAVPTTQSQLFRIGNSGTATGTFSFTPLCTGVATNCLLAGGPATEPIASMTGIVNRWVTYTVSSQGTGAVRLIAMAPPSTAGLVVADTGLLTVIGDQAPPTITFSPAGPLISRARGFTVNFCDSDGVLTGPAITLNGVALTPSAYSTITVAGCATATQADFANAPLQVGSNAISAQIGDGLHTTTTPWTVTFAPPPIAAFQPQVSPKNGAASAMSGASASQWFTVRNGGTVSAVYALSASCPGTSCQTEKTTLALAPGAVDSTRVTYTAMTAGGATATVRLTATFSGEVGGVIADTGSVVATTLPLASLAAPRVEAVFPTRVVPPGASTALNQFNVYNTGTVTGRYAVSLQADAAFTWPSGQYLFAGSFDSRTDSVLVIPPGQGVTINVNNPRPPLAGGWTGRLTVTATYIATDGSTSSNNATMQLTTQTPNFWLTVTPSVSQPLSAAVDRGAASHAQTFTIANSGTVSNTYSYALNCPGDLARNCHTVSGPAPQTNFTLAPAASAQVTVGYDATGPGNTGLIEILVTDLATNHATGEISLTVATSAGAIAGVGVSPTNTTANKASNSEQTAAFMLTNAGSTTDALAFTASCTGVVTCSASGQTGSLNSGGSSQVVIAYHVLAGDGGTGTLTFSAHSISDPTKQGSGVLTVSRINFVPLVVATVNPGTTIERGQCVTIAAGDAAAYECGDLRLVHALPGMTTMGKTRMPTLIYDSRHQNGVMLFAADVSMPAGNDSITSITGRVFITPYAGAPEQLYGTRDVPWNVQWNAQGARRIVVPANVQTLGTGAYQYRFVLDIHAHTQSNTSYEANGVVAIVNRNASPFGSGWWLDGLEQLVSPSYTTTDKLWVGGDGSTRLYTQKSSSVWVVEPTLDRPDTLTFDGTYWYRRLRDGAYVKFDNSMGLQRVTHNAQGHETIFNYAGTKLSSITLPVPPSTGTTRAYAFVYDYPLSGSSYLSRVDAPSGPGGQLRRTQVGYVSGTAKIETLTDPDGHRVILGYDAFDRVSWRRNRRDYTTTFVYDDIAHTLRGSAVQVAGTASSDVARAFCAAEAASILSCASPSGTVDTAEVRTTYDGPRSGFADLTTFYLTPSGAPKRIVDALGRTTTISRSLTAWPFLATRVTRPGGAVDSAEYDLARALPLRTIARVDDTRYATTRIKWDSVWTQPDTIFAPEGEVTSFTYDANGNRKTQTAGTSALRRATFGYDGLNRVITVLDSGATAPSRVFYDDALGNTQRMQTPTGIVSYVDRDVLGRPAVTRSPINAAQTHFTRSETFLDIMDRDTLTATTGPRVVPVASSDASDYNESLRDSIVIRKFYDAESNVDSLRRHINPNPNNLSDLVTRWTYDALDRKRTEVAPDGKPDSLFYGDGANVTHSVTRKNEWIDVTYDALNRMKTRTLPGTGSVDIVGVLTVVGDIERFEYDDFGNLRQAANAAAIVDREYNIGGTLKRETQRVATASGQFGQHDYELTYTYDLEGRRLTLSQPWQVLSHMVSGNVGPLDYGYNQFGDLDHISGPVGRESFNYFYDGRGRLDSLAHPNGIKEIRKYDDDGRLTTLLHRAPAANLGWHTDGVVASDTIQRAKLFLDAMGRVDSAATYGGDVFHNAYTTHGGLAWFIKQNNLVPGRHVETYTLDPLGNLYDSAIPLSNVVSGGRHVYDPQTGRLSQILKNNSTPDDFNQTSVYDAAGNQQRFSRSAFITELNSNLPFNLVTDAQSAYDGLGRLRFFKERPRAHGNAVVFPEDERVDQETRYDALGRRVWVHTTHLTNTSPSSCGRYCYTQRFVWDGDQLLGEFRFPDSLAEMDTMLVYNDIPRSTQILDPPPPWRQYSWLWGQVLYTHGMGMDQPLGVYRGGAGRDSIDLSDFAMYPHHDWRGNASAISFRSASPTLAGNSYYTPPLPADQNAALTAYGNRTNNGRQVTSWVGSLLTGQQDASGLQYRRNRYYDPQSGRFTQEDPIGLAGGINLYGFAGGDPVNFSDPFGLCCFAAGMELRIVFQAIAESSRTRNDDNERISPFGPTGGAGAVGVGGGMAAAPFIPNPDGRRGSKEHRDKVAEVAQNLPEGAKLEAGGGGPERAISVGGGKIRYPDVLIILNEGTQVAKQVGRQTKGGDPVARERRAMEDLRRAGLTVMFVPYEPKKKYERLLLCHR